MCDNVSMPDPVSPQEDATPSQAEPVAPSDIDLSVLTWTEEAVGDGLLAYMMGCDRYMLRSLISGDSALSDGQTSVARELMAFRNQMLGAIGNLPDANVKEIVCHLLTQIVDASPLAANQLRQLALGIEEIPMVGDELDQAIFRLALEALPAFLLPPSSDLPPMPGFGQINHRATSVALLHPQAEIFSAAVLRDPKLKKLFAMHNEHTGYTTGMIYRNTGRGGSIQLSMIPETVLRTAWRRLQHDDIKPETFAHAAVEELRTTRGVLERKSGTAIARQAFTGVLLPPGARLQFGDALVRSITDDDRQFVPESLKGQLAGTDQSGNSTVINYDGDVLLEYEFPYKIRIAQVPLDSAGSWPPDMTLPAGLQQTSVRLRFSLMLAVEREARAQLIPTWLDFDEPLEYGYSMSLNDPRQGTAIMPVQLTDAEARSWQEWYDQLNTSSVAKIKLALTRILRAVAERREPSDVLIDSVIAWENLFGTKEGEPTFRITTCLAKLLGDSATDRLAKKSKFGKIYKLRSDVVHGNRTIKPGEQSLCYDALETAISAVKRLVAGRMDILALPDGARRSAALLLGD